MQNDGTRAELPVPVEVEDNTGRWMVDGLPMVLVPQHLITNSLAALEDRLGAESMEVFRASGNRSARQWCAHESARLDLSGAAVLRHYLDRLSRRGWGQFTIDEFDEETGHCRIRVAHSALISGRDVARSCYVFEGWLQGALEFIGPTLTNSSPLTIQETHCAINGDEACVFASN
ncbi:hypothetical protein EV191_103396 [Tamaricihabitans halophyticus]|uniref:DUF5943 domain-containing protein n=1 Tax=Tamaricihabitans halophyticus TaxID=1262583 RepID=A0A4R2R481_9PSEU|nr:DUF5943 domain-containing protein [Tamaricihabitans halophyticus]TCP54351.1 hypothetical protein EV191_103396 [Tamaricihabitans halophyticus]